MKTLFCQRLTLRDFTIDDLVDFNEYCVNPNVGPNAGWEPHESIEESKQILQRFIGEGHTYAIVLNQTGRVVGSVGVESRDNELSKILNSMGYVGKNVEIGYALAFEQWGKGIMTEACQVVIDYCFSDLGVDFIICGHFPFNQRSKRVIEKCGFEHVLFREKGYEIASGEMVDEHVYCLTKEKYEKIRRTI